MKTQRIYSLFLKKLKGKRENHIKETIKEKQPADKEQEFRVLISFINIPNREKFVAKYANLNILRSFDIVPTISLILTKDQVMELEKEILINQIEEDQKLYISIFDVIELLELNIYRQSQGTFKGHGITIGIIDNGINTSFPSVTDIISNQYIMSKRKNSVRNEFRRAEISHGTIIASIIGNQFLDKDNNQVGIAPAAKIIDFDISNLQKEYYFSDILEVFDLILINEIKIDILLMTLTTSHPSDGNDILSIACDLLVDKGIIIICPAGNFGPESHTIGSPGAAKKVITIGSLSKNLTVSNFSGRGPTLDKRSKPDFCLPGTKIKIPLSNDLGVIASGTSLSAAIGAAIIALIKESNPNISHSEVLEVLKDSCIDLNDSKAAQGNGMVTVKLIFEKLNLFYEKVLPYNYLIKRSLKFSIEISLLLILIFYFVLFFRIT